MVDLEYILKIVRELEIYFITRNNFRLDGTSYSFILFIPVTRYGDSLKYNLILSAKKYDIYSRKEIISDIFTWLNNRLSKEELRKIESIVVANSNSPFVKNLGFVVPIKEGIKEINDISVGDVTIHYGILIYSTLLKKLKQGNAVIAKLKDGSTINMGVDGIDQNLDISYYTGKGLRELFPQNANKENQIKAREIKEKGKEYLVENHYYDKINLNEILEISS